MVLINGKRDGYSPEQCIEYTMTVGEMIEKLQEFNLNDKVLLINDNGYTFGSIYKDDIH